eukprot:10239713-Lingulodinium_polyedra.AAC.1
MAVPDIWQKVGESVFVFKLGKWELVPVLDWNTLNAGVAGQSTQQDEQQQPVPMEAAFDFLHE